MHSGNLFSDIPAELPDEHIKPLLAGGAFRVERIVSRGHTSPDGYWYDQDEHEWVLLLSGGAELEFDEGPASVVLTPGDYLHIPAGARHRVVWTDEERETVWLAVFHHP